MRPSHPRAQAHQTLDASAAQAEEVPGLLVGGRFLGAVEEAARERGGRRGPQRHADRQRRLDGVVDVPARRLGGLHVLVVRTEAAHPATGLTDEVVVDVVDEGAVAVLEVLDVGDAGAVVQHGAAHGHSGAHALADNPLLVLVFAGDRVALVVHAGGEAGAGVGAAPSVDACALEEFGPHLEEVVGHLPPHRAQARAHLEGEACELHRVAGHVALVVAAPVVEEFAGLVVGFPVFVEVLRDAPSVLGGDLVGEGRQFFGAVEPLGFGRGLGGGHVGLDRVDEGAERVDGDGLGEGLVVFVPDAPEVVGPQFLLFVEHAVEELVGAGAVGDGRGGHAEQRIHGVVLRFHTRGLVPRNAVSVLVGFGLDGEPHAAVDGVREVVGECFDGVIGVAACAGQAHECAEREHVGHAARDSQVD